MAEERRASTLHGKNSPSRAEVFIDGLREKFRDPETQYRPGLRWWLAEGLHTDVTLKKNVREIHASGFGGAEFLAMPEPGADSSIYGWGSQEWTDDTRLIIEEATRRGLGFSLTSGAHWATANLPDSYVWQGEAHTPDSKAASQELDYATLVVASGKSFSGNLPYPSRPQEDKAGDMHGMRSAYTKYVFQGVVAARIVKEHPENPGCIQGTDGVLDLDHVHDLSASAIADRDGKLSLSWTAPADGPYVLFFFWMHGTGQTAEPSVSTNYTINYLDSYGTESLIAYWEEVVLNDELKKLVRKNGLGEIYMDSLELLTYGKGGLLWGFDFKEEFRTRRGYDITPYIPFITMEHIRVESFHPQTYNYSAKDSVQNAKVDKIRNDFFRTMTDMYCGNVLAPLQSWLHSLGMTLRAEPSYGVPFEISVPARYIDGIETESFAQNADVDLYRGMVGAAHMYGRVFSSETGAIRGRNYYYDMDYWTQVCLLQFAAGVNRTVFHGYSAVEGSEADTYWPGHEGMYAFYSERFNSRQPASLMYPEWNRMLSRSQKILRQGRPLRDLLILRTDYLFINYGQEVEGYYPTERSRSMHDKPYFWKDMGLQEQGYTYDYASPQLLEDEGNTSWTDKVLMPGGPAYQAVVIYQSGLELSSARRLLAIARDGVPVLFVNGTSEVLAHGGHEIRHDRAASASTFLGDKDEDVRAVVDAMKALPNVREIDGQRDAARTLKDLGVIPRVAFPTPNRKLLTVSRMDDAERILYTFIHAYKFDVDKDKPAYAGEVSFEGKGVPYSIDTWSGEVREAGLYSDDGGRTSVPLALKAGEAVILALHLDAGPALHAVSTSADGVSISGKKMSVLALKDGEYRTVLSSGKEVRTAVAVPARIPLETWDITVEDWNEGEKKVITEKKFGHETREVYFTTTKTELSFPRTALVPWKDLPASREMLAALAGEKPSMADVSGVGSYATCFEWPYPPKGNVGAFLTVQHTGGGLVKVRVNGKDAPFFNIRSGKVDVTPLLVAGTNTVEIVVTTSLTNRMIQRGYGRLKSGWTPGNPGVRDYGIYGDVAIVPYVTEVIN